MSKTSQRKVSYYKLGYDAGFTGSGYSISMPRQNGKKQLIKLLEKGYRDGCAAAWARHNSIDVEKFEEV